MVKDVSAVLNVRGPLTKYELSLRFLRVVFQLGASIAKIYVFG